MAYLGNRNATGENNSFKILDDLAFTATFDGADASTVNVTDDTITINNHRFLTGSRKNGLLIGTVNVAVGATIDVATGSVLMVVQ